MLAHRNRRSQTLAAAALVLALPLLAGCGFNKATDKPYIPAEGTYSREGTVDVLSAVVVAAQPDSGTFIASLANKSSDKVETLQSLSGSGSAGVTAGEFDPISVDPRGFVNLADTGGVTLTGTFGAGSVLPLTLTFESGESVTLDVPVTYACQEYTGLDHSQSGSAGPSSSSTSPSDGGLTGSPIPASPRPSASSTGSSTVSSTASSGGSESPTSTSSAYVCGTNGGNGGR